MPIYAYKCSACQHEIDVLQKTSDAPLTLCPNCGAHALAKQLTAAGFQLKGSGWYVTDFRNNGAKTEAKPEAGKTETKTEAKPESKTEPKTESKTDAKPAEAAPAAAGAGATSASGGGGASS